MKHLRFLILLTIITLCALPSATFGQKITLKKGLFSYKYKKGDQIMDHRTYLNELYLNNEAAYLEAKKVKRLENISMPFGLVGGFMIGWQLGNIIRKEPVNNKATSIGLGLSFVNILCSLSAMKARDTSLRLYNEGIDKGLYSQKERVKLDIKTNGASCGLYMTF